MFRFLNDGAVAFGTFTFICVKLCFSFPTVIACVQPYGTAVGHANGIAETTIAYIFTFIPLIATFFKPACGFIVDRTQNATAVLLALQTIALVSFGLVFSSQYIQRGDTYMSGLLSCSDGNVISVRAPSSCIHGTVTKVQLLLLAKHAG